MAINKQPEIATMRSVFAQELTIRPAPTIIKMYAGAMKKIFATRFSASEPLVDCIDDAKIWLLPKPRISKIDRKP